MATTLSLYVDLKIRPLTTANSLEGFALPSYPILNGPSKPSSIKTLYPVIKVFKGGFTGVQFKEHESLEVSVKVRIGACGRSTAHIVRGFDL